jgi:hypothetical protein
MVLREREDAEAIEPCGIERYAKLRFVHPEAAGSPAGRGEINILFHDIRGAEPGTLKAAQILEQIAYREIDRIAQTARAILLRDLVRGAISFRQTLASVSGAG